MKVLLTRVLDVYYALLGFGMSHALNPKDSKVMLQKP